MIGSALLVLTILGSLLVFERDLPAEIIDARYVSPASQFLKTQQQDRIHFRDQGASTAPPVVLIHGANGSLHQFEMWVPFMEEELRIITLDLPGHGLTGATHSARYNLDADISAIRSVTEHLGIERFVLGGHSMGGGVALAYASEFPDQVSALLLIDSVVPWLVEQSTSDEEVAEVADAPKAPGSSPAGSAESAASDQKRRSPLRTLFGWPGIQHIGRHLDPALFAEGAARSAYANESFVTEALIQRYIDLSLRTGSREALFNRIRDRANAQPRRIHFEGPVLILWGELDTWTPSNLVQALKTRLPQAEIKTYPSAGHLPMEEASADSAKDVIEFLQRLDTDEPVMAPLGVQKAS